MTSPEYKKDEIDLIEFFQKIFSLFKDFILGIFKWILLLFVFIFRNIHYLAIAAVIGAIIGFGYHKASKRYYTSDLVARSNGITNDDMIGYLNDLSKLCEESNYASLADLLEIDDTISDKIKNIEAFWYIDVNKDNIGDYVDYDNSFNISDTSQQKIMDRFLLRVELYDNNAFTPVRDGLYKYIKNNPYLEKLNLIRQNNLKEMISFTHNELIKLDSLQNVEYYKTNRQALSTKEGQITFMADKQTQLYYTDKMRLMKDKQFYEQELQLSIQPITVIKDFTPLAKEENSLIFYLKSFVPVSVLLGLILILIIKNKENLKNIYSR